MYCRNCGKEVSEKAVACPGCGVPPRLEKKFCPACGGSTESNQALCTKCGATLAAPAGVSGNNQKMVAGILGIVLGALGIHKFYLGYQKEGIIMLVVTLVGAPFTCGLVPGLVGVVGLIEGILYLTKSDEEFQATYVQGKKAWF